MTDRPLLHIADANAWAASTATDAPYAPPSLAAEGFVHCSYADQLSATVARHFGAAETLLLLWLDAAALGDALVVEDTTGHGAFPHVYAAIPREAVRAAQTVTRGPSGWDLPATPPAG